ncbi:hypothetical protein Cob_v002650 [Colletotrichum orbiculare MAFF 240422]|uniref:Uncharacterized protein n=1 Tax=Colletotrichum orbiculare (strain 104-T / ATCC 96160 / CBS 514.97 / LARS 414 / MAFF 240422) TaxID=1213857 RepID=A0A484G0X7_COLOR|nr:hypothetical protein Cob_v002650 [Colletotrichum orbiculare MAFF 240422]
MDIIAIVSLSAPTNASSSSELDEKTMQKSDRHRLNPGLGHVGWVPREGTRYARTTGRMTQIYLRDLRVCMVIVVVIPFQGCRGVC